MTNTPFFPLQTLAAELLPHLPADSNDGSHDLAHLQRVWSNVRRIQAREGGDLEVLLAATVLHDCVAVEKNSPLRAQASTLSAERAAAILADMGWPQPRIEQVTHAVMTHSYSAGLSPQSLEAKILQDSDRLDSMGAVGIARCFYVSGRMGSALYDVENPTAAGRDYRDNRFTIEHFHTKLLKLASGLQTGEGARLAALRHQRLASFLAEFMEEIGVD
ncbi:phosphohydrolase [Pseudomonas sp. 250J]|uniref:HD domain-containing protein n=1 Tax=Pseudomonas peradeniyensis TaxID=2745488 RepID=A0ABT2V9W1_9PSED|nr:MULTISPECIES: HD domain-containing protein [Pseudomonas]KNX78352.1 phosphohydrolase [Pseudomonas sp. 250J]MCU7238472.1 HD domain-containing protein [Pseudomonas peradeniyensis]MCU7281053.1 HD domain-containing protein [Pseudomonas peradeniyensis]QZA52738.1 HD domain-containing protein [Pseudomonas sp. 2hn]